MKARFIGLLSTVALAVGTALLAAGPSHAATPAVQIAKVYYNSPGSDTRSNKSLNAEYVRLTNRRSSAIKLKGWTLRDKANHVYTFSTYTLGAGKSVYIHTGKGTNGATHRYWGLGNYVWNNTGDAAYLRNSARTLVDSCTWGSKGSYTNC